MATVEISTSDGAVFNTVATDTEGHYQVESLKTGNDTVKFIAPLHQEKTKTVMIEKNIVSSINVDLIPESQPMEAAQAMTGISVSPGYNTPGQNTTTYTAPQTVPRPPVSVSEGFCFDAQRNVSAGALGSSSSRRRLPHRPHGSDSGDNAGTSSQSDILAQVVSQMLNQNKES